MDGKRAVIVVLIFVLMASWCFAIFSSIKSYKAIIPNKKLETIYDTPSNKLQEIEYPCEKCGQMAFGINHEIVCRNEKCPLYGIPIKIDD